MTRLIANPGRATNHRRGLTLLELVVVVLVLVALAGILVPILSSDLRVRRGSEEVTAPRLVTETTMRRMRDAIMGAEGRPGYRGDLPGRLPATVRDLFVKPAALADFDMNTRTGWRGPYILEATGRYHVVPALNFTADYGAENDPALLDGWGRPIVIQYASPDADKKYVRLISAGENGVIDTLRTDLTAVNRGDDLVLFLRRADVP